MTREQKKQLVEKYIGIFDKPGVYLMCFKGLNVAEITTLRGNLREADVSMQVVKNSLAKRALKQIGIESLDNFFDGPIGVVWSQEDSVAPARVLLKFIKKYEKGDVKAGLVDGAIVTVNEIKQISALPPKQAIQANLASALNAPIRGILRALIAVPEKFVRTVKEIPGS